ncbi:hypothetical protein Nwat_0951 [Nitrosococcus watsonii C-113]|uniref:Uncharacterized protein n=1 Tax=Nitrosococcus watsoni (strain C-113) TaxID=105559 RepID=D8K4R8_NITWC|nr:hypothetical protein Nwat_0951 [Nitrosococcus watsonii C-113]
MYIGMYGARFSRDGRQGDQKTFISFGIGFIQVLFFLKENLTLFCR